MDYFELLDFLLESFPKVYGPLIKNDFKKNISQEYRRNIELKDFPLMTQYMIKWTDTLGNDFFIDILIDFYQLHKNVRL